MKKILLAFAIASSFTNIMASDKPYESNPMTPERAIPYKYDGKYYVGSQTSPSAYYEKHVAIYEKFKNDRIAAVTGSTQEEKDQKIAIIESEYQASLNKLLKQTKYAEKAIEYMKNGYSDEEAKKLAAAEELNSAEASKESAKNQSGYNDGSVTSSLSTDKENSTATTIANNDFKQFNELDCSYEEVSNYIDKSLDKKTKAFSTSPNFSSTFKNTATKSTGDLKGDDEAECQTIFHDAAEWVELQDFSFNSLPTIPSYTDLMADVGNKASEQLSGLVDDLYSVLREGFCSRMSTEYLGELAGDLIDDEYREGTKGTPLDGTKTNNLDKESGQNSFTYKVIKNQTEYSNSDLIKAIDVTRDDQGKYQKEFLDDELDDWLDEKEEELFGK